MDAQTGETKVRLNASPSKRILLNAARAYSPDIAIAELVDNAIDGWTSQDRVRDLNVDLRFEFSEGRATKIRVSDDGGGVPMERLEALVKTGAENPHQRAIGVWGQGLKVACIVLAQNATFRSRFREGPVYRIPWLKEWWEQETWDLWAEIEPDSSLPPGNFEVLLEDLKAPLRREEVFGPGPGESLVSRLARIYSPLLSQEAAPRLRLTIYDGDTPTPVAAAVFGDPSRIAEVFAYPPGFMPTQHLKTFGRSRSLTAKAMVGLLPEISRDLSGVTMYGKGRLFSQALKEGTVGFGTRGAAMIPASHPSTWRLLVLVYFDGRSEDIPWKSPTKEGYAENNPFYKEIRAFISEIAAPYAAFTRQAKRLDILPYSKAWRELGPEQVRREVAQYARDEALVQSFLAANEHLLDPPFGQPPVEINHDKESPKRALPCLNVEMSRAIATNLAKRDPKRDTWLWSEAALQAATSPSSANPDSGARNEPTSAPAADVVQAARLAEVWKETRPMTVRIPVALFERIESVAGGSVNSWILHAVEQRVARDVDPLFAIPASTAEFRPIVQVLRTEIRRALPDLQGLALFGSVARGSADRASDIDLLVVHPDRLAAQRLLNETFQNFRYPPGHGERYEVRCETTSPDGLAQLRARTDARTKAMLDEAIWLEGGAIRS